MEVKMGKSNNVLVFDCSQAVAIIKKVNEGYVLHPLSSSALEKHIKECPECAEKLNEALKKSRK